MCFIDNYLNSVNSVVEQCCRNGVYFSRMYALLKSHMFLAQVTLTFGPMTFLYEIHRNPVKMHLHTKNELSISRHSKVIVLQICDTK